MVMTRFGKLAAYRGGGKLGDTPLAAAELPCGKSGELRPEGDEQPRGRSRRHCAL